MRAVGKRGKSRRLDGGQLRSENCLVEQLGHGGPFTPEDLVKAAINAGVRVDISGVRLHQIDAAVAAQKSSVSLTHAVVAAAAAHGDAQVDARALVPVQDFKTQVMELQVQFDKKAQDLRREKRRVAARDKKIE